MLILWGNSHSEKFKYLNVLNMNLTTIQYIIIIKTSAYKLRQIIISSPLGSLNL